MITNHKASLRRDIVGIGLCAIVAVFALTKAPVSVAELVSDAPMSAHFFHMPISLLVSSIVKGFGPGEVTGLEQLGDRAVSVTIEKVPAREALQGILNCAGFAYEEHGNVLVIVPLKQSSAADVCGSVGMKLE